MDLASEDAMFYSNAAPDLVGKGFASMAKQMVDELKCLKQVQRQKRYFFRRPPPPRPSRGRAYRGNGPCHGEIMLL